MSFLDLNFSFYWGRTNRYFSLPSRSPFLWLINQSSTKRKALKRLPFLLSWVDQIKSQKRVHYKWTLNTPVLRCLSNFFTIEISAIHVVDINLYPVLVQEQLCQHWSFSRNPNRRYWRNRTCLDEHTFFKALSFVLTCSVAAVLYYNSPECHNTFVLMWILWDYSESRYFSIAWMRSFKSLTFSSLLSWYTKFKSSKWLR